MKCELCPRRCGVDRSAGERGFCGAPDEVFVARSALHFWEEPPISGERGSGTIFFTYCPLRCSYCQNAALALGAHGRAVTCEDLVAMMLDLQQQGALNINCVTPTHYAPQIREALREAREVGLALPCVWNTSGYETREAIELNRGLIDVYLTDFKYATPERARAYSSASDYVEVATAALDAMVEACGEATYDEVDAMPRMVRGVIVRHLLLPGGLEDSKAVVKLIHERYGSSVRLSLMNQYTPLLASLAQEGDVRAGKVLAQHPELAQRTCDEDYERLLDYADALGIEDYFWQEGETDSESFIPSFDFTGVITKTSSETLSEVGSPDGGSVGSPVRIS